LIFAHKGNESANAKVASTKDAMNVRCAWFMPPHTAMLLPLNALNVRAHTFLRVNQSNVTPNQLQPQPRPYALH